ncbi:MAG: RsmB/NOP family class I SAM-dependent RNA methyltransferase, partial [Firmicutes bacterium]|nr:RsmB/NOP family class I SAM-dependent RNA methyltransferase [Bacillota bacterium]
MGILSLPEEFETRMEAMLGEEEYAEFLSAFERERSRGLRLNPLKLSSALRMECERNPEGFRETAEMPDGMKTAFSEFGLRPVPWAAPFGFFYDEAARPGKSPLHEAGLYYLQEPSAMSVAALAEVHPGDKVLDLCAAPGGKSTMLAGALMGEGLLISNEINPGRAKILSQNIERMGISNAIVTNETPEKLAQRFPSFFDKVIVDAPCSGEGLFRKEEQALAMWSPENVAACAKRQAEILDQAAVMVKSGGELVYSTCTFAPAEDENSILSFLERHPEFSMKDLPEKLGEKREAFGFDTGHPEWCGKPEGAEEL